MQERVNMIIKALSKIANINGLVRLVPRTYRFKQVII